MWSFIWHTFFFDPIYNGLVFFIDVVPGGDVGIAIILTTAVVKIFLLPLSIKVARMQRIMKELDPKLKEIKEKHKDDREQLARATMDIYRNANINPFASILLLFIQIPIVIALYWAVSKGGGVQLPLINTDILYGFIPTPETVNMIFVGIVDMAGKSLPLAILAGALQFVHAQMSMPKPEPRKEGAEPSLKDDFARSMQMQMRYVMPIIIGFVAYTISAAIGLYFVVSSLAAITQEQLVKKHR